VFFAFRSYFNRPVIAPITIGEKLRVYVYVRSFFSFFFVRNTPVSVRDITYGTKTIVRTTRSNYAAIAARGIRTNKRDVSSEFVFTAVSLFGEYLLPNALSSAGRKNVRFDSKTRPYERNNCREVSKIRIL